MRLERAWHSPTAHRPRTKLSLQYDYIAVGHVTIDVLADGSRAAGGSALYGALQASRLGRRSLVFTSGVPEEVQALLEPYRAEVDVHVVPARDTTTLETQCEGGTRRQRLTAWAGPIVPDRWWTTEVLHLAPVARELPSHWQADTAFRGLTAQGLVRHWPVGGGEVSLGTPAPGALGWAAGCDAIVLSAEEQASCAELLEGALAHGALAAITDGPRASTILLPSGERLRAPVSPLAQPVEDLGAGDVFAATLFVALARGLAPEAAGALANAAARARMQGHGPGAIATGAELGFD
jgi:sugar/nucleoside kinase (ribokinase family)